MRVMWDYANSRISEILKNYKLLSTIRCAEVIRLSDVLHSL